MSRFIRLRFVLLIVLLLPSLTGACSLPSSLPWSDSTSSVSFVVVADPRSNSARWCNALSEIRDQNVNPAPKFDEAEFIVVVGDIDPLEKRYADYQEVFAEAESTPVFLPVMGNHDIHDRDYMRDSVLPDAEFITRRSGEYVNYFVDWRNVRVIAVDTYSDYRSYGVITEDDRAWVEEAIISAPEGIDHIFVAFHEPAFPRYRHLYDSFNQDAEARDAFWNMLVANNDRVRAVFVAHTHSYSRMCVADPASEEANDPNAFPDQEGGIYQVDVGNAGNLGVESVITVVLVQVDDDIVSYRVLEAGWLSDDPFSVVDEWKTVQVTGIPSMTAQR